MMITLRGTDMNFGVANELGNYSVLSGGTEKKVSQFEMFTYAASINEIFKNDEDLKELVPINPDEPNTLFDLFANGLALCKLALAIDPECGILEKALNK